MTKRVLTVSGKVAAETAAVLYRGVSDAALHNHRLELQRYRSAMATQAQKIDAAIGDLVKEENRRNSKQQRIYITDHAIVRYLERYTTCDITGVEQEILEMLADGRREVAINDGVISTVLPEGHEALANSTEQEREIYRESQRTTFEPLPRCAA